MKKSVTFNAIHKDQACQIQCGWLDLDWFVHAPPEASICVSRVDEDGNFSQWLAAKGDLMQIAIVDDD